MGSCVLRAPSLDSVERWSIGVVMKDNSMELLGKGRDSESSG